MNTYTYLRAMCPALGYCCAMIAALICAVIAYSYRSDSRYWHRRCKEEVASNDRQFKNYLDLLQIAAAMKYELTELRHEMHRQGRLRQLDRDADDALSKRNT